MTLFYEIYGTVKVRPCPEVVAIVKRFNNATGSGQCLSASFDRKTRTVSFEGGAYMSYSRVEEIEAIVCELGNFATAPAFLQTESEEFRNKLYVGPPELKTKAISALALETIQEELEDLLPEDRAKLLALLTEKGANSA